MAKRRVKKIRKKEAVRKFRQMQNYIAKRYGHILTEECISAADFGIEAYHIAFLIEPYLAMQKESES